MGKKIKEYTGKLKIVSKKVALKLATKSALAMALVVVVIVGSFVGIGVLTPNKVQDQKQIGVAEALDSYFESNQDVADIEEYLAPTVAQAEEEVSFYDSVAMAQVDTYVNVRSGPGTDFEVVGIIRNNCAATIISEENGWYNIQSGNVTGYILAEYFITGDAAEVKAREVGYINATVTAQVLNVRETQSIDSAIMATILQGEEYDVVEYGDGWVYLNVDASLKGWVSMDYVTVEAKFDTALTLAEESARIAEEQRLAAESAAASRAANVTTSVSAPSAPSAPYVDTSDKAALRAAVVAYALQFVGNPYRSGGRSLITGTDCSGFTMLVYQAFGYSLSPSSSAQPSQGVQVAANLDSLLPGDILYRGGSHVALYIGNGQVVHASTPATGIKIAAWNYGSWTGAIRIIN